jgi:tight adherence protein B
VTAVVAVLLAAAAGAVLVRDPTTRLQRLDPVATLPGRPTRPRLRAAAAAAAALLVVAVVTGAALLAVAAGVAVATVVRVVAGRARRRRADSVRTAVVDLLTALAAELRAGSEPRAALAAAGASGLALLAPVVAAARSPVADPAAALDLIACEAGAGGLADLAVTWRVVTDTGAGQAAVVERLAAAARADAAVRREVAAQLAGPRATALLLAGLPAAGVGLGTALGADPLGFLLGGRPGRACLLAGVLLVAAGTTWTEAIARRAEPP